MIIMNYIHFVQMGYINSHSHANFVIECEHILLGFINTRGVIIAGYDVLDQSERAHLYNHLSNYAKNYIGIITLFFASKGEVESQHM